MSEENEIVTMASGLRYEVMASGDGLAALPGKTVRVHYQGWLEDGTIFDSSDEPFEFRVGAGNVIPGWEFGVLGMLEGEVRRLWIPSDLAYGEIGCHGIPPNANLYFDVELVSVG
jgi:FKBP-type peptidyl-prolyl cis-trans isomerase